VIRTYCRLFPLITAHRAYRLSHLNDMKPSAPQSNEKYRILIIGGSSDEARPMLGALTAAGFECRHAPDGGSGLSLLQATQPHLVILDLDAMGANGQQMVVAIRATGEVPIVTTVSSDDMASEVQSLKAGADDYVVKPSDVKRLVARLVARLRRCYIYDRCPETGFTGTSTSTSDAGAPAAVPSGWANCESCGYMGPRARFEYEDATGKRTLLCPNCKQSEYVVFSIG
jgi:CheY-like chemotaxis protein